MDVFRFSSVIAQHPQFAGERRIGRRNATTVPHDSEILRWKKRKRARARNRADALAAILRAKSLSAIFYHPKPVFFRGQENSIHVGGMPVKMDRKNSDRARSHRRFQKIDIDAVRLVDVDEDRSRAAMNHGLDRWKRGMRRTKNLVTGAKAHRVMPHQRP